MAGLIGVRGKLGLDFGERARQLGIRFALACDLAEGVPHRVRGHVQFARELGESTPAQCFCHVQGDVCGDRSSALAATVFDQPVGRLAKMCGNGGNDGSDWYRLRCRRLSGWRRWFG
jgi:hypothetical protein